MKALSVKQPFAFLIGNCEKSIELRSWKTDYRGDLLICASKSEKDAWVIWGDETHQLPAGVMMCVAELVDVRPAMPEDAEDACMNEIEDGIYAWVLDNIRHVSLKKVNGRLRLFDVDDDLIEFSDGAFFDEARHFETGRPFTEKSIWLKYE